MTNLIETQENQEQNFSDANGLPPVPVKSKTLSKAEKKAMIEKDLMKYLGSCTREFLDELAIKCQLF